MKLYTIKSVELSKEEFAPFGQVIDIPKDNPERVTDRFNSWPKLGLMKVDKEIQIGISSFFKRPFRFAQMERHLHSMETMLFLNGPFYMPFAIAQGNDPEELPKVDNIKIFKFNSLQGAVLNKLVWHWTPFPLSENSSGMFIFETGTVENDLIIKTFKDDDVVKIDS